MSRSFPLLAGLAASAAVLSLAAVSLAQERPAGPPSPEQHAARMHEHMEARAHHLHDLLNLRPDQEPALQAFLASMAPPEHGGPRDHMQRGAEDEHVTTPQRLDQMAARMAEHQAAFQHRAEATRRFYAALSPEQQRAFDAMPMFGEHAGMGGHRSGGPGMHHPDTDGPEGPGPRG